MAKAATSMPPAATAPGAGTTSVTSPDPNADDLLSQMADQEIERLLTEAQLDRAAAASKPAPAWNVPDPAAKGKNAHVSEALSSVPHTETPAEHDAALAAKIDSVFDEIVGETPL